MNGGLGGILLSALQLELRKVVKRKRFLLTIALYLFPPAIVSLVAAEVPAHDLTLAALLGMGISLSFQLVIPLSAILHGTTAIRDELEDQTLVYLILRPIPRPLIIFVKWAANALVLAITAAASSACCVVIYSLLAPTPVNGSVAAWFIALAALSAASHLGLYVLVAASPQCPRSPHP